MTSSELTRVTGLDGDGAPGRTLVDEVFEAEEDTDGVVDALLAAALDLIETFGIRRLRMDDVARRAGYGRATLYRRFATRDDLVWAVVTREIQQTLTRISTDLADIPDIGDRMVEAFAVTLEQVRANPLMCRLREIEPDLLLPHLTTGGAGALDISRRLMVGLLRQGRQRGELHGINLEIAAEMMVRLAHSLLLTPQGPVDLDDPVALRRFARAFMVDPLFRLSSTR